MPRQTQLTLTEPAPPAPIPVPVGYIVGRRGCPKTTPVVALIYRPDICEYVAAYLDRDGHLVPVVRDLGDYVKAVAV